MDLASRDELLETLLAMGFSESDCLSAIALYGNNTDMAISWLCERPVTSSASGGGGGSSDSTSSVVFEVQGDGSVVSLGGAVFAGAAGTNNIQRHTRIGIDIDIDTTETRE